MRVWIVLLASEVVANARIAAEVRTTTVSVWNWRNRSGQSPQRVGVGHMVQDLGVPWYRGGLDADCITLAEAHGAVGYRTLLAGRWHVGGEYDPANPAS